MTKASTSTVWIGMDVHQNSITMAYYLDHADKPQVVKLPGDLHAVRRQFRRLAALGTPRACYGHLALATFCSDVLNRTAITAR